MISEEYKNYRESQKNHPSVSTADLWIALALCAAVMMAGHGFIPWLLWAIAAGAATRSYQLLSAGSVRAIEVEFG